MADKLVTFVAGLVITTGGPIRLSVVKEYDVSLAVVTFVVVAMAVGFIALLAAGIITIATNTNMSSTFVFIMFRLSCFFRWLVMQCVKTSRSVSSL